MVDQAGELVRRLEDGTLSRRAFIGRATAAGLSMTLIGSVLEACGGGGGSTGASATSNVVAGQARRGGTAQIALAAPSQKASLDPIKMASDPEQFMTGLVYDPLVDADEATWKLLPGLAESWEVSPDSKKWTFKLREGVKFHDGKPMTSRDVVYTIKRHLDSKQGSPLYARLSASLDPSGVKADGANGVVLNLKIPDAYLGVALAYQWAGILPYGNTDQGIGTGPFKVRSWKPGQGFEMLRNPDYWVPGKPYLDAVRAIVINDPSAKIQSIVAGSSDVTNYIDPSSAPTVEQSSTAQLLKAPGQAFQPIIFPRNAKPFDDPKVIQALKLAVDRDKMVSVGLAGNGTVVPDIPIPPSDPGFPKGLVVTRNIEMAKQLLKEAGHPNGIEFDLAASDAVSHINNLAVVFAQSVAEAGIKVNVKKAPVQTYFDQYFLGKRPFIDWWNREQVLDIAALLYREKAPFNETKTHSAAFDAALDKAQANSDPATANGDFAAAMKILAAEGNQVIAAFSTELIAVKKHFHARPTTRYIVDFRDAYVA